MQCISTFISIGNTYESTLYLVIQTTLGCELAINNNKSDVKCLKHKEKDCILHALLHTSSLIRKYIPL